MENIDWKKFLSNIGNYIYTKMPKNRTYYDKSKIKDNWLGYKPATLEDIEKKEIALKISLPHSYKNFLRVSNGFKQFSLFNGQLLKVSEIDWLINKDKEFVELMEDDMNNFPKVTDEQYFIYGDEQDDEKIRLEYFRSLICISEWVDGSIVLLNPLIKFGNEFECWIYASWSLGAVRYQSFTDLMIDSFEASREILEE